MTTLLDSFSFLNTGVKSMIRNKKNDFPLKVSVTKIRSIFQENFVFLREKNQLQSCIRLLFIKSIYLIKFSLILILIMYTILFFFQNSFFTNLWSLSRSKQLCPVFPHLETNNYRTKLLSSFFLNKNTSILYIFVESAYPTCFTYQNVLLIIFTHHNFNP